MDIIDDDLVQFAADGAPALSAVAEAGYVEHDSVRIWFATCGAGPPVVLLHGGMTDGGVTDEDIELLEMDAVESAKQTRYCDLSISFYEELMKLPRSEAVTAMRFLLEQKLTSRQNCEDLPRGTSALTSRFRVTRERKRS